MNIITRYQKIAEDQISNLSLKHEPKGLYDPISYVLGIKGKRIRPAICMAMCHFFSGSGEGATKAALGLEVFHNFTLLHDDIMDNAPVRRNLATVHEKWDANTAILSGDAMMIVASQLLLEVPISCLVDVQKIYLSTALQVCEGQQLDMDFERLSDVSVESYLEMIRLKTAVLLAASFKIGSLIGGAGADAANSAYAFGQDLGLAFQLQDDYLDVFGNENEFGKSIGGDIVSNKKTFLLISCLERCNAKQKEGLMQWLSMEEFDRDLKIAYFKELFEQLGIGELAKEKMASYYQSAMFHLGKLPVADAHKQELSFFAEKLINRSR